MVLDLLFSMGISKRIKLALSSITKPTRNLRIAVVKDERFFARPYLDELSSKGYSPVFMETAFDAIQQLTRERYDAVVIDPNICTGNSSEFPDDKELLYAAEHREDPLLPGKIVIKRMRTPPSASIDAKVIVVTSVHPSGKGYGTVDSEAFLNEVGGVEGYYWTVGTTPMKLVGIVDECLGVQR